MAGKSKEELKTSGCINGTLIYEFTGQQSMWMEPLQVECQQNDGVKKDSIQLLDNSNQKNLTFDVYGNNSGLFGVFSNLTGEPVEHYWIFAQINTTTNRFIGAYFEEGGNRGLVVGKYIEQNQSLDLRFYPNVDQSDPPPWKHFSFTANN